MGNKITKYCTHVRAHRVYSQTGHYVVMASSGRHLSKLEKRPKLRPHGFGSNFGGAAFCLAFGGLLLFPLLIYLFTLSATRHRTGKDILRNADCEFVKV